MPNYGRYYNTKKTSQRSPIPGREHEQVVNNDGGYVYAVSKWTQLDRFLILGTRDGTFYVGERELSLDNAKNIRECIKEDGVRVVVRVTEFSDRGRAPRNDEALFVLVMCVAFGDAETRRAALVSLPIVARTGEHLIQFTHYLKSMARWNRSLRSALGHWYNDKSPEDVAYQIVKYQNRRVEEGNALSTWSHRDILRLAHPKPRTELHNEIFEWAVKGWDSLVEHSAPEVSQIWAFEMAKRATKESEIISLINDYRLTREMIPTNWLNSVDVWSALLQNMPMTAMIRNLGKMTQVGLIKPMSDAKTVVCSRLRDEKYLKGGRIHPMKVLVAAGTYAQGHGERGKLSWSPSPDVVDALNDAFHLTFDNVEPTNKRIMLCLDLSNSMGRGIMGMPSSLTARAASAAMALVTKAVEPNSMICGFTMAGENAVRFPGKSREELSLGVSELPISSRQRLDDVVKSIENKWGCGGSGYTHSAFRFTGTDCSLPMRYALTRKIPIDGFVVYTDSETWAGDIHPVQALDDYRNRMGIDARLVVVGMTSTKFSIADPNDCRSLDVVGFDTAAPKVISEFIAGTF